MTPEALSAAALHAFAEEIEESQFQGAAGKEAMASNAKSLAGEPQRGAVGFNFARVFLSGGVGVDKEQASGFHVLEHGGSFEIEIDFGGIEHLKNDHLMAARGKGGQLRLDFFEGRQEIRENDNEPTFADDFNDPLERRGQIRGLSAGWLLEGEHQMAQMTGAMARGQIFADFLVKGQQADRVSLEVEKVGDCRCEGGGVLGLGKTK
jgi:hypothetical protein